MSEEVLENQGEGQTPNEIDYKSLYEKEKQSKERILNESKDWKTRFQTSSSELESMKQKQVEQDGNLVEKVEFYKSKLDEVSNEAEELRTGILVNKLKETYRTIAPNCREIEVVLNDPAYSKDFKAAIDKDTLSIDDEVIKSIFVKDKERRSWLYDGRKLPSMASGGASENKGSAQKVKSAELDKMTPEEYKNHILNKYNKQ